MLEQVKIILRDQLGLPPSAIFLAAGLLLHLALNASFRRPATSPWGLLAPLTLGVALEAYEIWVQYRAVGLFASGNDPLAIILARHAADVAWMLAAPLLLVIAGWLAWR